MRSLPWMVAAIVAVTACSSQTAQEKSVSTTVAPETAGAPSFEPPAPGSRAAIGAFGLDLAAGNPAVKPGDDFFAYASGGWYDSFQIPPDRASFGVFNQLDELSKQRVRELIEQAAASQPAAGTPGRSTIMSAPVQTSAASARSGIAPGRNNPCSTTPGISFNREPKAAGFSMTPKWQSIM